MENYKKNNFYFEKCMTSLTTSDAENTVGHGSHAFSNKCLSLLCHHRELDHFSILNLDKNAHL
jgi:hypothetical protein